MLLRRMHQPVSTTQPFFFQWISAEEDREQVSWRNHKKGFGNRSGRQKNQITVKATFLSQRVYLKAYFTPAKDKMTAAFHNICNSPAIRMEDKAETGKIKMLRLGTQTAPLKINKKFSRSTHQTGWCGYSQGANLPSTRGFSSIQRDGFK